VPLCPLATEATVEADGTHVEGGEYQERSSSHRLTVYYSARHRGRTDRLTDQLFPLTANAVRLAWERTRTRAGRARLN
jgi:hypothetical protein